MVWFGCVDGRGCSSAGVEGRARAKLDCNTALGLHSIFQHHLLTGCLGLEILIASRPRDVEVEIKVE